MSAPCRTRLVIRPRRRSRPSDGACAFPVDPFLPATEAPALWCAGLCPDVVILDAAPPAFPDAVRIDRTRWSHCLADRTAPDGRHLIFRDGVTLHRIWLRCAQPGVPLAAMIACDAMIDLRIQAVSRLHHWLTGPAATVIPSFRPTDYQAQRLVMLLAILDLRSTAPSVSSHEVARRLVYPRISIGRGAEWKASPERRRTQRLIREAEAMMAGGYRALLGGRGGRQK
jgi:hypothetical protein